MSLTVMIAAALMVPQATPPSLPALDIKDTKGKRWTNDVLKKEGKVYFIEFWATWCTSCKQMEPMIKEVYSKFKGDRFEMLSISIDETPADVIKHLKEKPFPNPVLLDTAGKTWKAWKVENVPAFFLVKDGRILWQAKGIQKRETLEQVISDSLKP